MTTHARGVIAVFAVSILGSPTLAYGDATDDEKKVAVEKCEGAAARLIDDIRAGDRGALSSLYLMARSHDGALSGGENSAGRTYWERLFGLVMGQVQNSDSDDGIFYKFDGGVTDFAHLTVSLRDPVLRDAVKKAFDDDAEADALTKLQPWDDVLVEAQIKLPPKAGSDTGSALDKMTGLLNLEALTGDDETAEEYLKDYVGDNKEERLAEELAELSDEQVDRAMRNALAGVLLNPKKRHSFHLTGRYRIVDELIGQEERGLGLTWNWVSNREGPTKNLFYSNLYDQLVNGDSTAGPSHTYAIEGAWTRKRPIEIADSPALDVKEFEELKISFNWSTKFAERTFTFEGNDVGVGNSFTFSYMRPNEDFANERWIASNVTTFTLANGQAIPFTITWANKEEFIDADVVTGHLGFSLNFARGQGQSK